MLDILSYFVRYVKQALPLLLIFVFCVKNAISNQHFLLKFSQGLLLPVLWQEYLY